MKIVEVPSDGNGGPVPVYVLDGEVDVGAARAFRGHARDAVEAGQDVIVVDLSDATSVDWTIFGALIGLGARMERTSGHLLVVVGGSEIATMFDAFGTEYPFRVFSRREEALEALKMDDSN